MVGSPRSWGTGENNFRGQETTQSTQNPGKVRLLSKRGARTWEKRVSKKAPGKKGDLRARLQRDLSAKDSNHLLIQLLVSHWDILRGLITGVRSRRSLLPTWFHRRAGGVLSAELPRLQPQRWGGSGTGMALAPGEQASSSETSPESTGAMSPTHLGRVEHSQAASCTCRPSTQHHTLARAGILCSGLHSAAHFWQHPTGSWREVLVGINPEAGVPSGG